MKNRKIIIWDLETLPDLREVAKRIPSIGAWPGRTFKADVNSIICFGYKILGEKKSHCINAWDFKSNWKKDRNDDSQVVKAAAKILEDADGIITHNGKSFDVKVLNARLGKHGLPGLPKGLKHADTKNIAKNNLSLYSNSLNAVAKHFGCTPKLQISNKWDLWVDIIYGQNLAQNTKLMTKYCKQDVDTLEEVYHKLKQYDTTLPNMALYGTNDGMVCHNCGSDKLQKNGYLPTKTTIKQRYRCTQCGTSCSGELILSGRGIIRGI